MDIKSLYREIVNEHNLHPEHKHDLDNPTMVLNGVNPSCGDDINLQLKIENGIVTDAAFNGSGCAISQASTDMMCDQIIGKSEEEALSLAGDFKDMIHGTATQEQKDALDEAAALEDISHMPARVKCAMLGWRTMKEMIEDLQKNGTKTAQVSANNSEVCGSCQRTDCDRK
ncbi:MAG: SUF system NifU family Fe-S cluster assembly protein [Lachnospiraceae bacterium]|jgi:nitrogen fixation NifU-like protein